MTDLWQSHHLCGEQDWLYLQASSFHSLPQSSLPTSIIEWTKLIVPVSKAAVSERNPPRTASGGAARQKNQTEQAGQAGLTFVRETRDRIGQSGSAISRVQSVSRNVSQEGRMVGILWEERWKVETGEQRPNESTWKRGTGFAAKLRFRNDSLFLFSAADHNSKTVVSTVQNFTKLPGSGWEAHFCQQWETGQGGCDVLPIEKQMLTPV